VRAHAFSCAAYLCRARVAIVPGMPCNAHTGAPASLSRQADIASESTRALNAACLFIGRCVRYLSVSRLRGIKTAPASLESTVLCVAPGLDLFYTRLHPSRSYDMLDEEFSFLLLIVTLAALAAGAFVTQGLSIAKDTARRWR